MAMNLNLDAVSAQTASLGSQPNRTAPQSMQHKPQQKPHTQGSMTEKPKKNKKTSHIVRFTVPDYDTITSDWLNNQKNMSESIRKIIHDYVREHGCVDRIWQDDYEAISSPQQIQTLPHKQENKPAQQTYTTPSPVQSKPEPEPVNRDIFDESGNVDPDKLFGTM